MPTPRTPVRLCAALPLLAVLGAIHVLDGFAAPEAAAASLYDASRFHAPVADRRAARPGDSLTVLVYENASASASADTATEKKGGLGFGLKTPGADRNTSLSLSDDFAGKGRIQRSGKVLAQITVTVDSVESNGELNVRGDQLIEVNGETQSIRLQGRVRPADISDQNTVASNRLANARIDYVGNGVLGEKQRAGVLTRFLSWLGIL